MGSYKYIRDQLSHIRGDPKLSNQRITLLIRKRSDVIAEVGFFLVTFFFSFKFTSILTLMILPLCHL